MASGPNYHILCFPTLLPIRCKKAMRYSMSPFQPHCTCRLRSYFRCRDIRQEEQRYRRKHYKLLSNTVTIKAGEMAANVEVQGNYESIEPTDSLGFALHLIIPESNEWEMYGTETKVVLQKVCPFDINNFTGYCTVTSIFFGGNDIPIKMWICVNFPTLRKKKNTIILRHLLRWIRYKDKVQYQRPA